MKKSIIAAGAASAVLAAMPVVGVFALDNIDLTDTLQLRIADTCNFEYAATNPHLSADITAKPSESTSTPISGGQWGTSTAANTYSADVLNGQTYNYFAQTNFKVTCNNMYGYSVTVTPTNFKKGASFNEEYSGHEWAYNAGGFATGDGSSWFIYSTGAGQTLNAESGDKTIVATANAPLPTTGHSFAVSYSAKVAQDQPADTYQATAVYHFAQLTSN